MLTSILGLVAWAAVFPVGLICDYLVQAGQIPAELWNMPKFFVAFGMILTMLEDEFLAVGAPRNTIVCSLPPTRTLCGCMILRPCAFSKSMTPQ